MTVNVVYVTFCNNDKNIMITIIIAMIINAIINTSPFHTNLPSHEYFILLKTRHIVAKFFPTSPGAERDLRQPRVRLTPVRRESRVLLQDGQMRPDLD